MDKTHLGWPGTIFVIQATLRVPQLDVPVYTATQQPALLPKANAGDLALVCLVV